jgi:hypothetical protein
VSKYKILKVLVRCLESTEDEFVLSHALTTILGLIEGNEKRKLKVCHYKIVPSLLNILARNPNRYKSYKSTALLIIHQLSLSESLIGVYYSILIQFIELFDTFGTARLDEYIV